MKFPLQRFTVLGNSMLPTLKPGQDVLVLTWFFKLKARDLVVFEKDGKKMIKRILKFLDRGKLVYIMGDNEKESTDSRKFGPVNKKDILGKVVYKLKTDNS